MAAGRRTVHTPRYAALILNGTILFAAERGQATPMLHWEGRGHWATADFPAQRTGTSRLMEPRARFPGARLVINRNFGLLWGGQAVSSMGDALFNTTLVLWIGIGLAAHRSWAPLAVSGVLIAEALPVLVIGPLAGVFVDRWDKRRTMLLMDAGRAALMLLLTLAACVLQLPTWASLSAIYVAVVMATICTQFFGPARLALLNDVVAAPDLTRASSLQQVTANLSLSPRAGPGGAHLLRPRRRLGAVRRCALVHGLLPGDSPRARPALLGARSRPPAGVSARSERRPALRCR